MTTAASSRQRVINRPVRVRWRSLMGSFAVIQWDAQGRRGASQFLARAVASITLSSSRAIT